MMLDGRFSMLPSRVFWALSWPSGACVLPGCGPGAVPELPDGGRGHRPGAGATPTSARNALTAPGAGRPTPGAVTPGPTAVVLGRRASDGTLRVGCVDSEDGAEALVRDSEDSR